MFDNILTSQFISTIGIILGGVIIGMILYHLNLVRLKSSSKSIIEKAQKEAEKLKKEKLYNFREELQQKRLNFQKDLRQKEERINRIESHNSTNAINNCSVTPIS